MSSNLRSTITDLATTFATSVLDALRGASIEEILAESRSGGGSSAAPARRGPGRPRSTPAPMEAPADRKAAAAPGRRKGGRLSRRSADDIASLVDKIVELLGQHSEGLRAEQIREALALEAKELPRPLADALKARRIAKAGQKRATTYFVRGAGGKAGGASKSSSKSSGASGGKAGRGRKGKPGPKPGRRGGRGRRKADGGEQTVESAG